MSAATRLRDKQIARLVQILDENGAAKRPAWVAGWLENIEARYEQNLRLRDGKALEHKATLAENSLDSIERVILILDAWKDELPLWKPRHDLIPNNGTESDDLVPMSPERFAAFHGYFTEDEYDAALRILFKLKSIATAHLDHRMVDRMIRPMKNEKPEDNDLVADFIRMWCDAMQISESEIKISKSEGSPAMNFLVAGLSIFLPAVPQRDSLERKVIDYRKSLR